MVSIGWVAPILLDRTHERRPGRTFRAEFAVSANITVIPKPSAFGDARLTGLIVGGMFFVLGLGGLIFLLIRPGRTTLGGTLLLCGAVMAGGVVLGWLFYGLGAPPVLTLDGDLIRLKRPLIRRRISTMDIQEIVRGRTGKARMPAYRFVNSKYGWLALGDILIFASQYDRVEIERLIAATGRPVNGDFTDIV
jgi:hypothetical protein